MEKLLTVKDAANKLNVSVSAIYKWIDERRITSYIDLGSENGRRCIRFKENDLEKMLTDKTKN